MLVVVEEEHIIFLPHHFLLEDLEVVVLVEKVDIQVILEILQELLEQQILVAEEVLDQQLLVLVVLVLFLSVIK